MLKFKLGDSVKVIRSDHREDYYMVGLITEIGEGFLPYRVHVPEQSHAGYWHKDDDLELATEQPAPAPAGGGDWNDVMAREAEKYLNMTLSELRAVTERIPHNVRLPGSPKLTEEMAYLLDKYIELEADNATLEAQLAAAEATAAGLRRERDAASEAYNKGWNGATQSMLSIIERALENPAGDKLTHIETLIQHFRLDYPKHGIPANEQAADAKPAGGA